MTIMRNLEVDLGEAYVRQPMWERI